MFPIISILFLSFVPLPSTPFFFGGGGSCGCNCPKPPICPSPPVCAPTSSCSSSTPLQYSYPASPIYQPGWVPAIPASPSSYYSTSYASAPAPLLIPSSQSYLSPIPATTYSVAPPILPAPIPPPNLYYSQTIPQTPEAVMSPSEIVTPPYIRSDYDTRTNSYEKQYEQDSSVESTNPELLAPPPPPPPPPILDPEYSTPSYTSHDLIYSTAEMVQPSLEYKTTSALEYMKENWSEKPGYSPNELNSYNKFEQFEKRHNVLKRMRTAKSETAESILRTNNTCNSIKLANVMAKVIVEDVTISKRMIQHATKLAFDGAKFDVFCATGEFSYSIHSRKYCEVTKEEVTCFAFR